MHSYMVRVCVSIMRHVGIMRIWCERYPVSLKFTIWLIVLTRHTLHSQISSVVITALNPNLCIDMLGIRRNLFSDCNPRNNVPVEDTYELCRRLFIVGLGVGETRHIQKLTWHCGVASLIATCNTTSTTIGDQAIHVACSSNAEGICRAPWPLLCDCHVDSKTCANGTRRSWRTYSYIMSVVAGSVAHQIELEIFSSFQLLRTDALPADSSSPWSSGLSECACELCI